MTTMVSRWRARRLGDEDGLSLVELMIALMIMGVALLALASVAAASLVQVRNSRARQQAVDAASAAIESLRLRDYSAVAMDGSDPGVQALGGCAGAFDEPTVETGVGAPVPYETTVSGVVTVRMLVTWYDDGDDDACADTDHDRTVKRVTALASWTDAGGTRTVEQSTLVSNVERGLPAPDFRLGTPEVTLEWTGEEADDEDGTEICVGHVLRNLGAQDGYEWFLERLDAGTPIKVSKGANTAEFQTADGAWKVRGFFEYPAQPTPLNPADYDIPFGTSIAHPSGLPAEVELMVDDDGNSDFTPRTQARLDPGEQARIWICYRPSPDKFTSESSASLDFIVTVRSQFDPNRYEEVNHAIRVEADNLLNLYLFDDDESLSGSDNNRLIQTNNGNDRDLPTYTMGPISAQGLQPEVLGSTSFWPDHDVDLDPDDSPGLRLRWDSDPLTTNDTHVTYTWTKTNNQQTSESFDTSTAWWHEQFSENTLLDSTATLYLYSTTGDMMDDRVGYPRQVIYSINLYVLSKNENANNPVDQLLSTTHTYVHPRENEDEFLLQTIPLTLTDPVLEKDQYLRLEVTCQSVLSYRNGGLNLVNVSDECVIGYDHESLPSRLVVDVVS